MYIYNVLHYTTIEMYISILCIDNRNECVGLNLTQMAPFEKKEQTCILLASIFQEKSSEFPFLKKYL